MLAESGFLIIGHRGAAGLMPENTLAGFRHAAALGVDAVELDVHSADGRLVVIHDARVERTTNGAGAVASLSFAALRALDAGAGERIPTLGEVLDALPQRIGVNVELKSAGTAEPAARLLANCTRPLLASSFDPAELARFRALCPSTPCAVLAERWHPTLRTTAAALDAWSINLADRSATPGRIAAARRWGRRCLVYTVNDAQRARQLREMGAHGVFTDFPDRLLRACRQAAAPSRRVFGVPLPQPVELSVQPRPVVRDNALKHLHAGLQIGDLRVLSGGSAMHLAQVPGPYPRQRNGHGQGNNDDDK